MEFLFDNWLDVLNQMIEKSIKDNTHRISYTTDNEKFRLNTKTKTFSVESPLFCITFKNQRFSNPVLRNIIDVIQKKRS